MPFPPSSRDQHQLMEFAWALGGGLSDEAELASVATQLLITVLHTDEAGFSMIDPARDGVTHIAVFPHPQDADHIRSLLATVIDEYPITMHLAREPALVPLRMSDLVPPDRFRWTRTYATMFEPRNLRHQLVLPLMADPSRRSRTTYSLTRADTDFTDDELLRAYRVQPLLAAAHAAIRAPRGHPERVEAGLHRHRLTPRELDVLTLMASGMTAVAIGHARGISTRTVHKHLENIYAQLEVHDRLQAVNEARRAGLLPLHPAEQPHPSARSSFRRPGRG